MTKSKQFHTLIVAGGTGVRFPGATPKQYLPLAGKPVLRHALENLMKIEGMASLVVVIHPDHAALYDQAAMGLGLKAPCMGSDTRKSSVYNGLKSLSYLKNEDIILVHDAARPFVDKTSVAALIEALETHEAATLAVPVSDTLRRENGDQVNREGLWSVQTPQAFRFGVLKKAHETAPPGSYTDDAGLVAATGVNVKLVQGPKNNIKITVPDDLKIAESLLAGENRTGIGFDVHAFSDEPGRKLMLCGVHIAGARGLAGHSDADVAMHALTDALLGAIGEGDIGLHFPPSNPKYKDMDSRVFLVAACEMMKDRGGTLQNADITIICEEPKISPYRSTMQAKIAEILKIEASRVNIKGTTTEGLGFTGRGEGIAAQAIVTVKIVKP